MSLLEAEGAVEDTFSASQEGANLLFRETGMPPTPAHGMLNNAGDGLGLLQGLADIAEPGPASDDALGKTINSAAGLFGPMLADLAMPGSGDAVNSLLDYALHWVDLYTGDGDRFVGGKARAAAGAIDDFLGPHPAPRPEGDGPTEWGAGNDEVYALRRELRKEQRARSRDAAAPMAEASPAEPWSF